MSQSPTSIALRAIRWLPTPWLPAVVAVFATFAWRAFLLHVAPVAYSYDGYQRWAGRDHILVQSWLPVTQSIIWVTAQFGGDLATGRLVMAAVAALSAGAGTLLAQRISEARHGPALAVYAGWTFVVAAFFGPWVSWGTVFYQESTFLLVLFSAMYLALGRRPVLGDLVMGLLGLVRYEGGPVILLYVAWRRKPGSLLALWGMGVWLALRGSGLEGFHASPVNFADWEGLGTRFNLNKWLDDVAMWLWRLVNSGGLVWIVLGSLVAWFNRELSGVRVMTLIFLSQVAITAAWLAGLEVSTSRMVVIPVAVMAVLGAGVAPWIVQRKSAIALLPVGLAIVLAVGLNDAGRRMRVEGYRVRAETEALRLMGDCPGCIWWVVPRPKAGTRARHDGCEVIQGISDMVEGEDFYCASWVDSEQAMELYSQCGGTLRYDDVTQAYVAERHLSGTAPPMPLVPADPALRTDDGADE